MSEKVKNKKDGAAPYVSEDELDITLNALKGLNSLRNQCITYVHISWDYVHRNLLG